ncbi:HAD family hydrolase [Candidatus Nomurabacteria bacterium CG10_big_fil_rev_8_21_14_0_10_35_16]|uniref:phosphomannomutase n=1 Tax=Candidatus Nomurabacteria bacterium CG10_big_fil_rev_8_21_14_0_10_35_16 TaxID=1974731 RepID=A0A2H0TDV7_9BACT|nr:MAG: HAD family hydrolase [Candidatus Nomurabacteria bacterium CG10_big_fil_rev_8_21_14_0_10_35_16]
MELYKQKEIIIFDLDGTLVKSKSDIDSEMATLLSSLLEVKKVAIISGGTYSQIEKSLLLKLNCESSLFYNLFIFPTCATSFYKYVIGDWENIYTEEIESERREGIIKALKESLTEAGYKKPEHFYGEIIEDRKTQITFSGLGQNAPLGEKLRWDPDHILRDKIILAFGKRISDFDAKIGGSTSIDINQKGIDKTYGIRQIEKNLNIPVKRMLFIGDALFVGGNDYPVISTDIDIISVDNPEETKRFIKEIIFSNSNS